MIRNHRIAALLAAAALSLGSTANAGGVTHTVDLFSLTFSPDALVIDEGDTVDFVWATGFHNVESGVDGAFDGAFSSGSPVTSPNTFSVTFDSAFLAANPMAGNVYPYYCIVHVASGMSGTITVSSGAVPTMPTAPLIGFGAILLGAGALMLHRRTRATS